MFKFAYIRSYVCGYTAQTHGAGTCITGSLHKIKCTKRKDSRCCLYETAVPNRYKHRQMGTMFWSHTGALTYRYRHPAVVAVMPACDYELSDRQDALNVKSKATWSACYYSLPGEKLFANAFFFLCKSTFAFFFLDAFWKLISISPTGERQALCVRMQVSECECNDGY